MSAQDNLQPMQFYHGSRHEFKAGDTVDPGKSMTVKQQGGAFAFFTAKKDIASAGGGKVYAVQPEGEYEPDPYMNVEHQAYRSKSPLRVIGEA